MFSHTSWTIPPIAHFQVINHFQVSYAPNLDSSRKKGERERRKAKLFKHEIKNMVMEHTAVRTHEFSIPGSSLFMTTANYIPASSDICFGGGDHPGPGPPQDLSQKVGTDSKTTSQDEIRYFPS